MRIDKGRKRSRRIEKRERYREVYRKGLITMDKDRGKANTKIEKERGRHLARAGKKWETEIGIKNKDIN